MTAADLQTALDGRGFVARALTHAWLRVFIAVQWPLLLLFRWSRWLLFAAMAKDLLALGVDVAVSALRATGGATAARLERVRVLSAQLGAVQSRLERELARGDEADLEELRALHARGDALAGELAELLGGGRR